MGALQPCRLGLGLPNDEFLLPWRSISAEQPGGLDADHRHGPGHQLAVSASIDRSGRGVATPSEGAPCGGSPAMASPSAPRHGTALHPPDPADRVSADPAACALGRPSSATLFRPRGPTVGPLPRPTWPTAFGYLQCSLRLRVEGSGRKRGAASGLPVSPLALTRPVGQRRTPKAQRVRSYLLGSSPSTHRWTIDSPTTPSAGGS
jgi:hypothetical protein